MTQTVHCLSFDNSIVYFYESNFWYNYTKFNCQYFIRSVDGYGNGNFLFLSNSFRYYYYFFKLYWYILGSIVYYIRVFRSHSQNFTKLST